VLSIKIPNGSELPSANEGGSITKLHRPNDIDFETIMSLAPTLSRVPMIEERHFSHPLDLELDLASFHHVNFDSMFDLTRTGPSLPYLWDVGTQEHGLDTLLPTTSEQAGGFQELDMWPTMFTEEESSRALLSSYTYSNR
jgi:hypothetical protein